MRKIRRLASAGRLPTGIVTALIAAAAGGCGSQLSASQRHVGGHASTPGHRSGAPLLARRRNASSAPVVTEPGRPRSTWSPVASIGGRVAAWIAQRSGVTLLRFDQQLVHLALQAGSSEPGGRGWPHGDHIGAGEIHRVVAGFNGGFKLTYGSVGFMANGRVAVPLERGLGSIVTYRNGTTQIAAWREGVPARGLPIASVRQNLHLLVDHGAAAPTVETCIQECWGSTLGGSAEVARSALGIRGDGQLVWAAGDRLSPARIARGLLDAGVLRAVELDINPAWVAGYLYIHHRGGPTATPVVPGQVGISGRFLEPYSRDFFTMLAN